MRERKSRPLALLKLLYTLAEDGGAAHQQQVDLLPAVDIQLATPTHASNALAHPPTWLCASLLPRPLPVSACLRPVHQVTTLPDPLCTFC